MSPPTPDSSSSNAVAENSDSKKTVWSRVGNEANPITDESTTVMGADSWPALGESAPKSDGSASVSVLFAANNQLKVNNPSPDSGQGKPKTLSGPTLLSLPSVESSQKISDKPVSQFQELKSKNTKNAPKGNFSPNSHGGSDHYQRPHKPFTRRLHNGGEPPNSRPHMPPSPLPPFLHPPQFIMSTRAPPAGAVRFVGPPPHPGAGSFVGGPPPPSGAVPFPPSSPPIRPFMSQPLCFPGLTSPIFYVTGPPPPPFVAAHPVTHSIPSPVAIDAAVLKQIEYYFSNDNLCHDEYLRKHMDAEGWVPASLIAGFNRIRQITHNVPNSTKFILDLLQNSELVEVQGEKIRRRGDWKTWILPASTSARALNEDKHGWSLSNGLLKA